MIDVEWSEWVPFARALAVAPRVPGVYMAREGEAGAVVYIGMAGERSGGGRPQGIRGRLSIYASGKGLASGLGEAVFDRALADPDWVRIRLRELETDGPRRAKQWGIEAFVRADLHVRWTTTSDRASAASLEEQLVRRAGSSLWNKASARLTTFAQHAMVPPAANVAAERVASSGDAMTQRVTTADLSTGQIRIPIAHKIWFPEGPQRLVIVLRGEAVACSWNPRLGPDRQRSGVLRPPPEVLRRLVTVDERLHLAIGDEHISLT